MYDEYKEMKIRLSLYEADFDINQKSGLLNMIDLYGELATKPYHDLANAIEQWIFKYADANLLQYIQDKKSNIYSKLIDIIRRKLESK
jgi:hypothetical protein